MKKILHRYAVIFGIPFYDPQRKERNIQDVVQDMNIHKKADIKILTNMNYNYKSDVIIIVGSDLNMYKFYKDGSYQFIECSNLV